MKEGFQEHPPVVMRTLYAVEADRLTPAERAVMARHLGQCVMCAEQHAEVVEKGHQLTDGD